MRIFNVLKTEAVSLVYHMTSKNNK